MQRDPCRQRKATNCPPPYHLGSLFSDWLGYSSIFSRGSDSDRIPSHMEGYRGRNKMGASWPVHLLATIGEKIRLGKRPDFSAGRTHDAA